MQVLKTIRKKFVIIVIMTFYVMIIFTAVFPVILAPYNPWDRFEPYVSPNPEHLLGTNDLGNDILSELIYGSRISLFTGIGVALLANFIGLSIGLFAGYMKGIIDEVCMGLTDIFFMIPRIPLIIILAAFLKPDFKIIILLMGLLWWPSTARIVRSKTLQIRETGFIKSAQCLGFNKIHIIFSDIFPNVINIVIPKFMLTVASAMITEASISFLGLGASSQKSWGMMINFAFMKGGFNNELWWWYLPPGLCITFVTMLMVVTAFFCEERKMILKWNY